MSFRWFRHIAPVMLFALLGVAVQPAAAGDAERILVVRERGEVSLQDGALRFTLLKIQGYQIRVRTGGEARKMKVGESLDGAGCSVTFDEIAKETRLVKFVTNCPTS